MKKIFFTLLVLAFYSIANASESSHREAVEKLLQATQTEKNIPLIFARMSSIIEQQFKQMQVPEEDMPILIKYKNKQIAVMKEELSWNKVKDDLATAYMRVYSEKEIIELTKFFTSPIGAKY
ncbi:MAG TPA: DUF2059 domain-containing protein, partial [Bdellovibrio sp.]|nr:DUF2059 domain-containing protein [Bdellovibrio sp.]